MTTAGEMRVTALEHALVRTAPDHGALDVRWRFENVAAATVHLLIRHPMTVPEGDPAVLDHSANEQPFSSEANAERPPLFLEIAGGAAVERRMSYQIVLRPGVTAVRLVGRFGYGETPPEPSWRQLPSWPPMQRWQRLVDAPAFVATVK